MSKSGRRSKAAADASGARRTPKDAQHAPVVHLTVEERIARGKAARQEVPRSSHGSYSPSATRPDPVALLQAQGESRVQELLPIRYGRMAASPFAFYRGAALIMASDLAGTPRSGLTVQACGDAHAANFGLFASPERRLVFDINDFDETLPGPWEWDVKRLATSIEIAGRDRGFKPKDLRKIVVSVVGQYREAMRGFAAMTNLDVWYAQVEAHAVMRDLKSVARNRGINMSILDETVRKAMTRDSTQALRKLTTVVDGQRRIIADPPLTVPISDLAQDDQGNRVNEQVRSTFRSYRESLQPDRQHLLESFDYIDAARRVVGVGSVGTRCWIIVMSGRDSDDPLILQMKEANQSVLAAFVGASRHEFEGERVVAGQRLMQSVSDIFLGWQRIVGWDGVTRDFYLRQFRDWKGSIDLGSLGVPGMELYGRMCAWTLAKAHARSGDRIAISAYLGTGPVFDEAVADFASAYADQNDADHAALVAAIGSGRITATSGI